MPPRTRRRVGRRTMGPQPQRTRPRPGTPPRTIPREPIPEPGREPAEEPTPTRTPKPDPWNPPKRERQKPIKA